MKEERGCKLEVIWGISTYFKAAHLFLSSATMIHVLGVQGISP